MTKYHPLATENEVDEAIEKMARQIIKDHPTSPLFVALLRGAAPFASKLMFEIVRQSADYHPELDYMMVSTYGNGQHAGKPHIVTDLAPTSHVKNRHVIVLDDVLDKGITADFVFEHLSALGAKTRKLAVLCDKTTLREKPIEADYKCFTFADNWLVGMGMDDADASNEGYRWLGRILEIKQNK